MSDGIRAAGVDVIDIGMVVTPMTYFAAVHLGTACSVMVTGSHNPPDYNGLKMVIDSTTLSGGLWLPVTMTLHAVPRCTAAK